MDMLIYLLIYGGQYVLPPILTASLAWLIWRFLLRGRPWAVLSSLALAVALSCLPVAANRLGLHQDLSRFSVDEIIPDRLDLPSGALLHLNHLNVAGLTCRDECPFTTLPFVTAFSTHSIETIATPSGQPGGTPIDLWAALDNPDRNRPFPFAYAFISAPSYWYATATGAPDHRLPHWPANDHGVHLLVRIPPDGRISLTGDDVLYRRFNIQDQQAIWGLWGIARAVEQIPSLGTIFTEIRSRAAPG